MVAKVRGGSSRPSSRAKTDARWSALFADHLPGYDPFATAAPGDWFDADAADTAVAFFSECLTFIEGERAGQPFDLEPWQAAFVGCLFGWKRTDGTRRYREALLYVPRKNGKTPLLAGIVDYVLFCDHEPGAMLYSAAAEKEQAAIIYRHAAGMIAREPELMSRARCYRTYKSIEYAAEGSTYKALSADADTKHGGNAQLVVVDELHAQPNADLVDVLRTSTGTRRQPLMLYITTADFNRPSICNTVYDTACKIRDGIVEDRAFLPVIYEAAASDDWTDPAVWARANPNLGVSIKLDYLKREVEKARSDPSYENTVKRLHLNIRTQQDVRWIPMEAWDAGGEPFDPDMLLGQECHAAIDFGWRDDFAALSLVFEVDELFYVLPWFWLPQAGPRDKRAAPTSTFIAEGLITLTPGNATDIDAIYATVRECAKRYTIRSLAIDPANARKQGQDLMNEGYEVIEFIQSKTNYNEPCRFLMALLKDNRLRHGGHKVLRWMASNAAAEENGLGQIMPKKKLSTEKIDGIVALTMALKGCMLSEDDSLVYNHRGIVAV